MTVSNRNSAESIIDDLLSKYSDYAIHNAPIAFNLEKKKALAALEEILIASKPELLVDILQDGEYYPFGAGYNSGIKDYEQNIRQAFSNGGGDDY